MEMDAIRQGNCNWRMPQLRCSARQQPDLDEDPTFPAAKSYPICGRTIRRWTRWSRFMGNAMKTQSMQWQGAGSTGNLTEERKGKAKAGSVHPMNELDIVSAQGLSPISKWIILFSRTFRLSCPDISFQIQIVRGSLLDDDDARLVVRRCDIVDGGRCQDPDIIGQDLAMIVLGERGRDPDPSLVNRPSTSGHDHWPSKVA